MKKIYKNNQVGRTMMETILVMGVIGTVALSIITVVGKVFEKYKSTQLGSQLQTITKNVHSRYSTIADYSEANSKTNLAAMIKDGVVPFQMSKSGKILSILQQEVTVAPQHSVGTNKSFSITFAQLQHKDCVDLSSLKWFSEDGATLLNIQIGAKTFTWPYKENYDSARHLPLVIASIVTSCKAAKTNVTWEFQ